MLPEYALPSLPKNWSEYTSIFNVPEYKRFISDNPLIVSHLGFSSYYPDEDPWRREPEYGEYLKRVAQKISDVDSQGRTVILVTPTDYLEDTVSKILHVPQKLVLLPTVSSLATCQDHEILGVRPVEADAIWIMLSQHISRVETCGEYADEGYCLPAIEGVFQHMGKIVVRDESCSYYSFLD